MSSQIRRFWAFLKRNETAKGLFLVGIVLVAAIDTWGAVRLGLNTEYPILVVSSGSMCPPANCTLAIGDLIVIRGQDPTTIQAGPPPIGSIIVFRPPPGFPGSTDPNYLVVHRVIGIVQTVNGLSFQTKGDANGGPDPCCVPASRVVGVYQYTVPVPYLGSAILAIRGFMYDEQTGQPNPQGVAVIVALVVALFAFEVIEPSKKKRPKATAPPSPEVQPPPEKPASPGGSSAVLDGGKRANLNTLYK